MAVFQVTGGTPLHGSVRIGGAKNASFKLMIASLLGSQESRHQILPQAARRARSRWISQVPVGRRLRTNRRQDPHRQGIN